MGGAGATPEPVSAVESAAAVATLSACGLLERGTLPVELSPERYSAYVTERNLARAAHHREAAQARKRKLEEFLKAGQATPPEESDLLSSNSAAELRGSVSSFVTKYRNSLGAHAFLKGMRSLVEQQIGQATILRWVMAEEAIYEANGEAFMADAVDVL